MSVQISRILTRDELPDNAKTGTVFKAPDKVAAASTRQIRFVLDHNIIGIAATMTPRGRDDNYKQHLSDCTIARPLGKGHLITIQLVDLYYRTIIKLSDGGWTGMHLYPGSTTLLKTLYEVEHVTEPIKIGKTFHYKDLYVHKVR